MSRKMMTMAAMKLLALMFRLFFFCSMDLRPLVYR